MESLKYIFENSQLKFDGEYRDGKKHGYGKEYSENGRLLREVHGVMMFFQALTPSHLLVEVSQQAHQQLKLEMDMSPTINIYLTVDYTLVI